MQFLKSKLDKKLNVEDFGKPIQFWSTEFDWSPSRFVKFPETRLINNLQFTIGMIKAKPVCSPVNPFLQYFGNDLTSRLSRTKHERFCRIYGRLLYLGGKKKSYSCIAASMLAFNVECPLQLHMSTARRVCSSSKKLQIRG